MAVKHLAFSMIVAMALLAGTAYAAVNIGVEGPGRSYGPGTEYLDANLSVAYDEFIPKDTSVLHVYFDDESVPRGDVSLDRYLHDESYYTFLNQTFDYNVTSSGTLRWDQYPEQDFGYVVSVNGLCGGDWCNNSGIDYCDCPSCDPGGPPYPCAWSMSTGERQGSVDGDPDDTGLKFMYNASKGGIPGDAIEDSIAWHVQKTASSPQEIDATMREACGLKSTPDPVYDGQTVWTNGWIIRYISTPTNPCTDYVGGEYGCRVTIMPFDGNSLTNGYRSSGGPDGFSGGGIYKTNEFVTNEYQARGTDVEWNGTIGEIILNDFESDAYYMAVYIPPNGPLVCAYTRYSVPNSSAWNGFHEITGASAGYLKPYTHAYARSYLDGIDELAAPDCPIPVQHQHRCDKSEMTYGAVRTHDPGDSVVVSSDFDGESLNINGTTEKKAFPEESFRVEFSLFDIIISDLTQEAGNHTMRIAISDGETTYGEESFLMFTCADEDRDGYCTEDGDCNDNNPSQNPGMSEICNGIDDDCDGQIDEGIVLMGQNLGEPCNDWPGSVCKGSWACNSSGTGLVCLPESGIHPGSRKEVCNNKLDDDCDGSIDEQYEMVGGEQQSACIEEDIWCIEGQTRTCGECKDGRSSCVNGIWGRCVGARKPQAEVCNRIDDDCDGIIDNVYGRGSVEDTGCQCYAGGRPVIERCNGIDDDCDGEIDEGVIECCDEGSARNCGIDVGKCKFGTQTCEKGRWGACTGEVPPELNDLCCNGIDDDCDGEIDEDCSGVVCNDYNDTGVFYWSMVGMGVMILICVLIYTEFVKKEK